MAGSSAIEWTDATWNPVTGCTRVSSGCDHCYAVAMTNRLEGASLGLATRDRSSLSRKYAGLTVVNERGDRHFNGVVRCHEDVLDWPLRKKKPLRIFVNSMSDLFHKDVPFEFIDKVFAVMALCPQHTFQVLTKRPERMAEYTTALATACRILRDFHDSEIGRVMTGPHIDAAYTTYDPSEARIPKNVWLGTSVEDQKTADERIPHLLKCPAAVRFLSIEPMLGLVDTRADVWPGKIQWVIVGGESGPGARPMHPDWVRAVRDQCKAAGVPWFFKQWGEWAPTEPGFEPNVGICFKGHVHTLEEVRKGKHAYCHHGLTGIERLGKKAAGAMLDGVEHREFPVGVTA